MPRLHLVLTLGRPDPGALSTTLLWSLMAHVALFAGALVSSLLPSSTSPKSDRFYVKLEAPPGGSLASTEEAPKPAPVAPAPAKSEPVPPAPVAPAPPPPRPAPPPTKTIAPAKREPTERSVKPTALPPSPLPPATPPSGEPAGEPAPAPSGEAPERGGRGAPGSGGGPSVGGTTFGEGDFEFAWYQSAIENKLESHWRRPISTSPEVQTTTVSFVILRKGTVESVEIVSASGNSALDLSVLRAVYDANPLPALPRAWQGDSVHVTMEFRLTPDLGP